MVLCHLQGQLLVHFVAVEAESAGSHAQTQMSSTKMNLEGSPAPPLSPTAAAGTPQQQTRGRLSLAPAAEELG